MVQLRVTRSRRSARAAVREKRLQTAEELPVQLIHLHQSFLVFNGNRIAKRMAVGEVIAFLHARNKCTHGSVNSSHIATDEETFISSTDFASTDFIGCFRGRFVQFPSPSGQEKRTSSSYSELLVIVTHAVDKLRLEWDSAQNQTQSKLDDRFLTSHTPAQPRNPLSFFQDLHPEVPPLESLNKPLKHIHLSLQPPGSGLNCPAADCVSGSFAFRAVLGQALSTSNASDTPCVPGFGFQGKALGSCAHGLFKTAFKAPTVNVVGQPDRAMGQFPVSEVPTTYVPRGPMQGNLFITKSSAVVTPHVLPVSTDVRGFLESVNVLAAAVQQVPKIERLTPLAEYWAS
ncbi:hypothetical protein PO909_030437 [Leuciscus waleckii]